MLKSFRRTFLTNPLKRDIERLETRKKIVLKKITKQVQIAVFLLSAKKSKSYIL